MKRSAALALLAVVETAALCLAVASAMVGSPAGAATFTYKPHGQLIGNSGSGVKSTKDYVPGMRFPIEKAPAYANSQVYMAGGSHGPGGGQCAAGNYSYPWWDNFCEKRSWSMPLCPSSKGHQGQDIRPGSCKFNTHWVVAAEDGTITSIGTYSVYQKSVTGVTHRYLHMKMNALKVKTGSKVKKGQRLGLVDNDFGGTGTTLHLHYDRKKYIAGVGTVYLPTYASLVNSYKKLIGPSCDAAACAKKSSCGAWGACGGLSTTCDTTGTRSRTCTTYGCKGAICASSAKVEKQGCTVNTDGKQVAGWGPWGACVNGGSGCATSGSKQRTKQVCKAGKPAPQSESAPCTAPTDGKVLSAWSAWSACTGSAPCAAQGTRWRTRSECKGGVATTIKQQSVCDTHATGKVISAWGPWSPCAGFDGPCDSTGTQQRTRQVCQNGAVAADISERPCTIVREGAPLGPWSEWSGCAPAASPCAPTGAKIRTRQVCKAGAPVTTLQSAPCVPTCAGGEPDAGPGDGVATTDVTGDPPDQASGGPRALTGGAPSSGCAAAPAGGRTLGWLWALLVMASLLIALRRRRAQGPHAPARPLRLSRPRQAAPGPRGKG